MILSSPQYKIFCEKVASIKKTMMIFWKFYVYLIWSIQRIEKFAEPFIEQKSKIMTLSYAKRKMLHMPTTSTFWQNGASPQWLADVQSTLITKLSSDRLVVEAC